MPSHPCTHEADIGSLNTAILEIKDTLRDLKDLLTSNAILEEQAVQFQHSLENIDKRLRTLELDVAHGKGTARWLERLAWAVMSLALGGLLLAKT
ncbi:MAG: hypothetical protein K2O70_02860 [Desulfovibrionaceae bacterium]|nr:hypothetical protein [Desulfovibrionaceae bacterium]